MQDAGGGCAACVNGAQLVGSLCWFVPVYFFELVLTHAHQILFVFECCRGCCQLGPRSACGMRVCVL